MVKSKRNPFGGNPFDAPALPFDIIIPNPFKGAENFDIALGLEEEQDGFDTINENFEQQQLPRQTRRRRSISLERQARLLSGEAPLTPEEERNLSVGKKDIFGAPIRL